MTAQPHTSSTGRVAHGTGPDGHVTAQEARRGMPGWVLGVSAAVAILVILEILSRVGFFSSAFPPISEDYKALFQEMGKSEFWVAAGDTMQGWGVGLLIAAGMAIPLGIIIGASDLTYHAFRPIVEFMRPVPSVAIIPFILVVFGISFESKLFLIVFGAFWPILIQTIYGVRDVDPVTLDTAKVFGFGRFARLWRVTFVSAIPYVATGLRIASTVALLLAVTAGLFISTPGLGYLIQLAQTGVAFPLMYGLIIATGFLGLVLNIIFTTVEKRVLHWHPAYRPVGK